ncbi:MAG: class I SAM-dependent methyltransferase [Verrucomicrobia bacterium]|nr:class I SAM-dependent methyltransferase [Verrucomicrobiota bacterium]
MKKFRYLSIALFFSSLSPLFANSPQWQLSDKKEGWNSHYLTQMYFHNSESQRQWAWELIGKQKFTGNESLLDFGCGDGKITAEMARILPNGAVVGADISEQMVHFANVKFPKTNFSNLEFRSLISFDGSDLNDKPTFDVVCSFCVFHLIPDPSAVLKNLKKAMKPGGKLLLVIPAGRNPALFSAAEQVFPKYGLDAPWKNSAAPKVSIRTQDGCSQLLQDAGFRIVSILMNDRPTPFFNKEEMVLWMVGNTSANWKVPVEIAYPFFNEIVDKMCELDPDILDKEGHILLKLSRLEVEAAAS